MTVQIPAEEQYQAWLQDPVTIAYLALLKKWREVLKEQWARGMYLRASPETSSKHNNAVALGQVSLLEDLGALEYEQLVDGLEEAL